MGKSVERDIAMHRSMRHVRWYLHEPQVKKVRDIR